MMLVLEAMLVYVLTTYYDTSGRWTESSDWATDILAVLHNVRLTVQYYMAKRMAKERLQNGWKPERTKSL